MKDALARAEGDFDSKMKNKDAEQRRAFEDWQAERRVLDRDLAQRAEDARRFARDNDELRLKNSNLGSDNAKLEKSVEGLAADKVNLDRELAGTKVALADSDRKLANKTKLAGQLEDQL